MGEEGERIEDVSAILQKMRRVVHESDRSTSWCAAAGRCAESGDLCLIFGAGTTCPSERWVWNSGARLS